MLTYLSLSYYLPQYVSYHAEYFFIINMLFFTAKSNLALFKHLFSYQTMTRISKSRRNPPPESLQFGVVHVVLLLQVVYRVTLQLPLRHDNEQRRRVGPKRKRMLFVKDWRCMADNGSKSKPNTLSLPTEPISKYVTRPKALLRSAEGIESH